ncbi:MAG: hypothetical protein HZB51_02480 [Chloroflexi bacterium]|nr:hypothetical protein [Chloroflexota bacterium]
MQPIAFLLIALVTVIILLIVFSVCSESILAFIHRRMPNFTYEGESLLLWGSVIIATFVFGLIAIYLLIKI